MIVGKITKLFGDRGEVVVRLYNEWDDTMAREPLWLTIDSLRVPIYAARCERRGQNGAVIRFDDIDSPTRAEYLIGRELESETTEPIELPDDGYIYMSDMVGWSVGFDGRRETGVIEEFVDDENNPLFVVSVSGKEVLIPAVEEFIVETGDKSIVFSLPEGLLELYQ